jgi:hypothetical protein
VIADDERALLESPFATGVEIPGQPPSGAIVPSPSVALALKFMTHWL